MAGITKTLLVIRRDINLVKSENGVRFGNLQKQLDELEARLDKLDKPAHTQTATPAQRKARRASASKATNADKSTGLPVPVPNRHPLMEHAGVGEDPR